jgi:hypothetical protein
MKKNNYSLAEIKEAYNESDDVGFYRYSIARFFFRPLSFYGAWAFLKIGITANQTTFLSWLLVIAGCFLYLFIPPSSSWAPLLLILGWAILDYMDGSMARVTNTRSKYGHFIDVVGAYFMLAFLPICVGISLYQFSEYTLIERYSFLKIQDPGVFILILGAFTSLNNILLRLVVLRMQVTFSINPRGGDSNSTLKTTISWIESLVSPRGLFFPFLILLTALDSMDLFIIVYFIIYTGSFLAYLLFYAYKLKSVVG